MPGEHRFIVSFRTRRLPIAAGLALLAVALSASGQDVPQSGPDPDLLPAGIVRTAVMDFETGEVKLDRAPQKSAAAATAVFCYINTDTVGMFARPPMGVEYVDWGILGGTAGTKCTGLSNIVTSFTFGYATTAPPAGLGGSLTLHFYQGYQGFGQDSGNCPIATFAFTNLPAFSGSSTGVSLGVKVRVDLPPGSEFCLPDGRFGLGYRGDSRTGPLLCLTGDGMTGPEPCTGNLDAFDVWVPDTKGIHMGTNYFGGPPQNYSSWYLSLARADLSATPASVATRNVPPNPPGSLFCTTAPLGGTLESAILCPPGYTSAFCFAFDTAVTIPLGSGQFLLAADTGGFGELLTGAGLPASFVGTTVGGSSIFTCTTSVPCNLNLCGFTLTVQALCAFGVVPFTLTSACDLTLGG